MVDTPFPKPKNGTAPPPFKRGQIEWGRPPQQVFRVDLPPRVSGTAPVPTQAGGQARKRPAGSGILSGSMIPGQTATPLRPAPLPPVTPTAPVPTPSIQAAPLPPVERPAPPPPEVHRAPVAAAPEPIPDTVRAIPTAETPIVPSYAAVVRPRAGVPMAAWIAGGVVAVVLAGVGWWVLKPDAPVPAVVAAAPPVPEATTASAMPAPVEAVPVVEAPADTAVEAAPVPRPTTTAATPAPTRAAPTTVTPSPTPRLNTETSVPRIDTAPLVVAPVASPPTAAEAPATDPEAPIQTRPQPLN